jgi:hypothetical protein
VAEEQERQNQQEEPLEMRVAALEDKLAGFVLSEDELETYRKVAKVSGAIRTHRSLSRLSMPGTVSAASGCISGCISPCDCASCGCIEGCISAASGCISGCISPCDCASCGCIEGCISAASSDPSARRRFSPTFRRFGSFGF